MTVNTHKDPVQGTGPTRCVALVGPQSAGKTTLMEALLAATGAIPRKGSVTDGSSIGDASEEARARQMRSEEHTSELQSLMRISYAVFCLKKKKNTKQNT